MSSRSADLVVQTSVALGDPSFSVVSDPVEVPFEFGSPLARPEDSIPPAQCKVLAISSGKGGTGKTTFTTNLGITLQKRGLRVLIIDADFGLANDHLLLGLEPRGDVGDVLAGRQALRDVLLTGPFGLHLLPGGTGMSQLSNLEAYETRLLARELACLEPEYDIVLVDLAAGISQSNLRWLKPAHEVILVTNPEVTALIDAYGLIKCVTLENPDTVPEFQIVLNRVRDQAEAKSSLQKLRQVAEKHLKNPRINYLGYIPFDRYLLHSIAIQEPAVLSHPRAFVTACLKGIEQKISLRYRAWTRRQESSAQYPSYFGSLERLTYE